MRRQWKSTLRVVLVRSHVRGPKGILVNQQGGSETSGKPISRITLLCPITAHAANLGMITYHADNFGPITRHGKPLCHPVDWVWVMSSDLGCESHSVCSNPDFVNVHFEHDLEATKYWGQVHKFVWKRRFFSPFQNNPRPHVAFLNRFCPCTRKRDRD